MYLYEDIIKTLKIHKKYIINCLNTNYTNGFIEGFNNKIKVIKKISFGYRSFYRFKRRILIISNSLQLRIN
ncbi:MAG: transposase [Bacilli bacterium]